MCLFHSKRLISILTFLSNSLRSTGTRLFNCINLVYLTYSRYKHRINPHELIPATEQDEVRNIPRFQATHGRDLPGFLSGEYAHPPINYFQKFIREGMNEIVEEHVTPMFSPLIVERYVFTLICLFSAVLVTTDLGQ